MTALLKAALSAAALTFLLLLALGWFSGPRVTSAARPSVPRPAPRLTAQALAQAYDANAVAADRTYKDQVLVIAGEIVDIGTEILGRPYVITLAVLLLLLALLFLVVAVVSTRPFPLWPAVLCVILERALALGWR
jgi:hypothetical protein